MSDAHIADRFADLHRGEGAFVIANPWDLGSARILEALGFKALATTSAGFAHALGRLDSGVSVDEKLAHCTALAAAVAIPVNADFENAYADAPEAAAINIVRAAGTGLAGASIEDYSPADGGRIYAFEHAVERVQAAAEALRVQERPFVLTARAENLIRGVDDLDDTIRRLQAFEAAGADVVYAPGLTTLEQVRTVTGAVGVPVNVLAPPLRGVSVAELAEAGAKRISVGGALARAALGALVAAGKEMAEQGTFEWTGAMVSGRELTDLLGKR